MAKNLFFILVISLVTISVQARQNVVNGYYMNWSKSTLPATEVPWEDLTHVTHAFIWPNSDGSLVTDEADYPGLVEAAKENNVKIIIAVGGWGSSGAFSGVVADPALRAVFIQNLKEYVLEKGYDGIDLDWEYPVNSDRNNVTKLITEMYEAFHEGDLELEISIAMPSADWQNGYNIPAIVDYIEWFGVMTYDFHGSWTDRAGFNSPLYAPQNSACNTGSIDQSMRYYLQKGVPSKKLVMGLASYGRVFNSANICSSIYSDDNNGASISYADAMKRIENGWAYHWDENSQAPWLQNADSTKIITFDDTTSFHKKVDYIREKKLKGAMVWALGYDQTTSGHELMNVLGALKQTSTSVREERETQDEITNFKLQQNYPNPFNPSTIIPFEMAKPGHVRLTVSDVLGREVAELIDQKKSAGKHSLNFDASELSSGIYLYKLEVEGLIQTHKMTLIK